MIRRGSVASGAGCRMRRERLIRPTVRICRPDKTRQRRIRRWLSDAA
ncbi:ribonucleoside reductase [Escherichia coli]|nr:ribonucleoside reductase [Escherichia coli]